MCLLDGNFVSWGKLGEFRGGYGYSLELHNVCSLSRENDSLLSLFNGHSKHLVFLSFFLPVFGGEGRGVLSIHTGYKEGPPKKILIKRGSSYDTGATRQFPLALSDIKCERSLSDNNQWQ